MKPITNAHTLLFGFRMVLQSNGTTFGGHCKSPTYKMYMNFVCRTLKEDSLRKDMKKSPKRVLFKSPIYKMHVYLLNGPIHVSQS